MPFIGQEPITGAFHKLDAITTSSTNTYDLLLNGGAYSPASANHLMVSLNGVIQSPGSSFTISGSQITFVPSSGTLSSSDSIDFIMALGNVLDVGTPTDGTVSENKIVNGAVTNAKIASGITSSKLSGALPAISGASLTSLPNGNLIQVATLTKTASDHPAGSPYYWMDISNCFTSTYNDYVIDYKIQSTDVDVNTLNFALETSGASLDSNDQFSSPTFASTTFATEVEYWLLGQGSTGSVRAAASTYCFLGANTSNNDASSYFEGRLWMKNVYSGTGFIYWAEHYMHNPNEYWEMPKGVATNAAAVNARGFRFFNETNASGNGESGNTRNVIGEITVFGVVGS